jgi:hypothetical protein
MESSYSHYTSQYLHSILLEYKRGVRDCGFKALAKRFKVKGGHRLLMYWYKKWDGTESSLTKQSGGDRRSILTPKEKKKYIQDFIDKRSNTEAVQYAEVKENIEKKTGKLPALRTVQDYGEQSNITSKKRKRVLKSQGNMF